MRLWDKELKVIEKPIIEECLKKYGNSVNAVSQVLLVSRSKIYNLLDRYDIEIKEDEGKYFSKDIVVNSMFSQTYDKVKSMLEKHYELSRFDKTLMANKLGISRTTLGKFMSRYGIESVEVKCMYRFHCWMPTDKGRMRLWDYEMMKIEKPIIEHFIKKHDYNVNRACAELGMNRGTFENRVELYDIKLLPNESCKYSQIETGFEMRRLSKPLIKEMLIRYLEKNKFNITKTAKELQIGPKKLRNFIDMTGIHKDEYI